MCLPALFVSHGAPTLALDDGPAHRFLKSLGPSLPRPKAILMVSAHWETDAPMVSTAEAPATIHDFFGFSETLHAMTYNAPGAPEVACTAADLLAAAGFQAGTERGRGLDHGAWVPLSLMFPKADIPVAQVSIQPESEPHHHLAVGRALRSLRDQGVLIVGSGSLTHNLSQFRRGEVDAEAEPWVTTFAEWTADALLKRRTEDLLAYRQQGPHAVDNHPTDEHFLPLLVAYGAGAEDGTVARLHDSVTYGALAMDAYAFS